MRISIDISQLAYSKTGVSNYLENLVLEMVKKDSHEFILFFSSFRGKLPKSIYNLKQRENVKIIAYKFPPSMLNIMWNKVHKIPIEHFVGPIDLYISSDWTEPPAKKAKKATILYDLIVYKHPEETAEKIVRVHKAKLKWVKKESDLIFCISESTKKDAVEILGIEETKLKVIYPGL